MKNGGVSSIYTSNRILHKSGSRKGKTKKEIALMESRIRGKINLPKKIHYNTKKRSNYMGYVKLGKTNLYANKDATEENKQPHFRGDIEITQDIPKGAKIGLAGWLNEKGSNRSLFFAVSAKEEDLEPKLDLGITECNWKDMPEVVQLVKNGMDPGEAVAKVKEESELPF